MNSRSDTAPQEPTTEAGRILLGIYPGAGIEQTILAIEAEARADALREAAERVRALPMDDVHDARCFGRVLAILDPEATR